MTDMSRQVSVPPDIFVIWDGMGLVAKPIERMPYSDPPEVTPAGRFLVGEILPKMAPDHLVIRCHILTLF